MTKTDPVLVNDTWGAILEKAKSLLATEPAVIDAERARDLRPQGVK